MLGVPICNKSSGKRSIVVICYSESSNIINCTIGQNQFASIASASKDPVHLSETHTATLTREYLWLVVSQHAPITTLTVNATQY